MKIYKFTAYNNLTPLFRRLNNSQKHRSFTDLKPGQNRKEYVPNWDKGGSKSVKMKKSPRNTTANSKPLRIKNSETRRKRFRLNLKFMSEELHQCSLDLNRAHRNEAEYENSVFPFLSKALALQQRCEGSNLARFELDQRIAAAGIRRTKSTGNIFTPILKLLGVRGKSTRSRWAALLRYAMSQNIAPSDLKSFIKSKGGIGACYKADQAGRSALRRNTAAGPTKEQLVPINACAIRIECPELFTKLSDGLSNVVVRKSGNQICALSLQSVKKQNG